MVNQYMKMNKAQRILLYLIPLIILGVLPFQIYARDVLPSGGLLTFNPFYTINELAKKVQGLFTRPKPE